LIKVRNKRLEPLNAERILLGLAKCKINELAARPYDEVSKLKSRFELRACKNWRWRVCDVR
jgi:hypothetical protein